jgi:2,3-bisphosphoglycerate-dependent phosphoglycerate mutase
MVLIVLRHGQSTFNKANILAGWKDVPLTEFGKKEAIDAANKLHKYNFDYVFTSDLKRTKDTCSIVKSTLNQNFMIKSSSALKERNYGELTGQNREQLKNLFTPEQVSIWRRSYSEKPPNGESLDDVKNRCGSYFDKNILPLLNQNKNILIISHSNTLRSLFVHLNIIDKKSIELFEISNCEPIFVDIKNKKFWYE